MTKNKKDANIFYAGQCSSIDNRAYGSVVVTSNPNNQDITFFNSLKDCLKNNNSTLSISNIEKIFFNSVSRGAKTINYQDEAGRSYVEYLNLKPNISFDSAQKIGILKWAECTSIFNPSAISQDEISKDILPHVQVYGTSANFIENSSKIIYTFLSSGEGSSLFLDSNCTNEITTEYKIDNLNTQKIYSKVKNQPVVIKYFANVDVGYYAEHEFILVSDNQYTTTPSNLILPSNSSISKSKCVPFSLNVMLNNATQPAFSNLSGASYVLSNENEPENVISDNFNIYSDYKCANQIANLTSGSIIANIDNNSVSQTRYISSNSINESGSEYMWYSLMYNNVTYPASQIVSYFTNTPKTKQEVLNANQLQKLPIVNFIVSALDQEIYSIKDSCIPFTMAYNGVTNSQDQTIINKLNTIQCNYKFLQPTNITLYKDNQCTQQVVSNQNLPSTTYIKVPEEDLNIVYIPICNIDPLKNILSIDQQSVQGTISIIPSKKFSDVKEIALPTLNETYCESAYVNFPFITTNGTSLVTEEVGKVLYVGQDTYTNFRVYDASNEQKCDSNSVLDKDDIGLPFDSQNDKQNIYTKLIGSEGSIFIQAIAKSGLKSTFTIKEEMDNLKSVASNFAYTVANGVCSYLPFRDNSLTGENSTFVLKYITQNGMLYSDKNCQNLINIGDTFNYGYVQTLSDTNGKLEVGYSVYNQINNNYQLGVGSVTTIDAVISEHTYNITRSFYSNQCCLETYLNQTNNKYYATFPVQIGIISVFEDIQPNITSVQPSNDCPTNVFNLVNNGNNSGFNVTFKVGTFNFNENGLSEDLICNYMVNYDDFGAKNIEFNAVITAPADNLITPLCP